MQADDEGENIPPLRVNSSALIYNQSISIALNKMISTRNQDASDEIDFRYMTNSFILYLF